MKIVNFLDVTIDLNSGTYKPFKKPNNKIQYVHKQSNHPPHIKKQIPIAVGNRLSNISSNEEIFNQAKEEYESALKECGYKTTLKNTNTNTQPKKNRKRNIVWYNPPFNAATKTNLGKKFLTLVKKHFNNDNPLHPILNKNSIKLSYSTCPNMKTIIQNHNNRIITKDIAQQKEATCNCRQKDKCPLEGKCKTETIVYSAQVDNAIYIGSTEKDFKTRYTGHKQTFTTNYKKSATTLSQYIWNNDLNPHPNIRWSIIHKTCKYGPGQGSCSLCNSEKVAIAEHIKREGCLNKRTEITRLCPHRDKFKLRALKED